jgi:hypothetical protein
MRTKIFFLIAFCSLFTFASTVSAQTASNFSNPGVEYKKPSFTIKVKKHDQVSHVNRFNSHQKTNGNGNRHPYISKKKKFQKQTMSLNKKHKRKDHGDRAPRTW